MTDGGTPSTFKDRQIDQSFGSEAGKSEGVYKQKKSSSSFHPFQVGVLSKGFLAILIEFGSWNDLDL